MFSLLFRLKSLELGRIVVVAGHLHLNTGVTIVIVDDFEGGLHVFDSAWDITCFFVEIGD